MSESTRNHKRKRSLQDSPVDLTKMKMAMQRVRALKEELAGIEETEGEVEALMTHVNSLEEILRSAKKPVCGFLLVVGYEGIIANTAVYQRISFSSVSREDLLNLGVARQRLVFLPECVAKMVSNMEPRIIDEVRCLRCRIQDIYRHVNMDVGLMAILWNQFNERQYEPGARMILDAVLLSLAKIASSDETKLGVAILPEMRIAVGDGVQVINPVSQYEIWLTGNVDYAVIQYTDEKDNKG
jgi:hypothetical protein